MSQITRCPACATTFKVVPDQLRISDGWVRCGQCKEVFHAASELMEMPAPRPVPAQTPEPVAAAKEAVPGAAVLPAADTDADPDAETDAYVPALGASVWSSPRPSSTGAPPAALKSFAERDAIASPFGDEAAGAQSAIDAPTLPTAALVDPVVPPVDAAPDSGGYELPFAELRDSGWPDDQQGVGGQEDVRKSAPEDDDGEEDVVASTVEGAEAPWAADPLDAMVGLEAHAIAEAGAAAAPAMLDASIVPGESRHGTGVAERDGMAEEAAGAEVAEPRPAAVQDPGTNAADGRPSHAGPAAQSASQRSAMPVSASDDEPGFVRAARRQALWRRPGVQAVLAVGALLLLGSLVVQVAWRERDLIAALHPSTRSALQAVCRPLGCRVEPLRRIGDLVIDNSSFTKARGDGFQLQLTLKNRGTAVVATPAVELTLTDAQDQPVVRRVLRPDELGAPLELPPQGEWSGTLPLSVSTDAGRVTGYRALAFYP